MDCSCASNYVVGYGNNDIALFSCPAVRAESSGPPALREQRRPRTWFCFAPSLTYVPGRR